jgi:RNA polymerase sigma-70 factor, ECF subfamily
MKELNDDELMGRLKAGQGDALAVLFDRYQRLVLSIALKIVRDRGRRDAKRFSGNFSGGGTI